MELNKTIACFTAGRQTKTKPLFQWNYGQILKFDLPNLPTAYEVHFSNEEFGGTSYTAIGNRNGVLIPDVLFESGDDIWAWMYLHEDTTDGETVYKVRIPIINRPQPDNTEPTPEQQSAIDQAIAALNEGIEQVEQYAEQASQHVDEADEFSQESEAWARGTKNGTPVTSEDEQYENNAKFYAEKAEAVLASGAYFNFYIDNEDGILYLVKNDNAGDIDFRLNYDTGELEVIMT